MISRCLYIYRSIMFNQQLFWCFPDWTTIFIALNGYITNAEIRWISMCKPGLRRTSPGTSPIYETQRPPSVARPRTASSWDSPWEGEIFEAKQAKWMLQIYKSRHHRLDLNFCKTLDLVSFILNHPLCAWIQSLPQKIDINNYNIIKTASKHHQKTWFTTPNFFVADKVCKAGGVSCCRLQTYRISSGLFCREDNARGASGAKHEAIACAVVYCNGLILED